MKWQVSPKHPLKLLNLAQIFTENPIYIREQNCIGLDHSRAVLEISFPGVGLVWSPPDGGHVKYITMWPF